MPVFILALNEVSAQGGGNSHDSTDIRQLDQLQQCPVVSTRWNVTEISIMRTTSDGIHKPRSTMLINFFLNRYLFIQWVTTGPRHLKLFAEFELTDALHWVWCNLYVKELFLLKWHPPPPLFFHLRNSSYCNSVNIHRTWNDQKTLVHIAKSVANECNALLSLHAVNINSTSQL
jgi:hypothetical protein